MESRSLVMKIGGSLLYKDDLELDKVFLRKFVDWFQRARKNYNKIVIIVGGGTMSRYLVDQVKPFNVKVGAQHRIGMGVTMTNAEVLRAVADIEKIKVPRTLGEIFEMVVSDEPYLLIVGGFKEGWSTDMDAAVLAHVMGVDKVYKLSNVDHVYTADPKKEPDARPIMEMTWQDYFKQFGLVPGVTEHQPGQNLPIGAYCAQFSASKGISFMVSGGINLDKENDLQMVLEMGSLIHP